MKNREYKALAAFIMSLSLVTGSMIAFPTTVLAANQTEQTVTKDETVYAKMNADGKVQSVTVSDQLKNVADSSQIQDKSSLKEITNVKGDETFTQKGEKLIWKGNGKDICYQGTTTKELPVTVKISYQLNGKKVTAEELKGKSGHLVIRYQYENTTGTEKQKYTPFLMATGMVMENEKFTNITVKNGKVISDGERNMVFGIGIPNVKEQLGAKEIDIPDYFEVEADVREYEALESVTVAVNDIFNELDTEKFDDMKKLEDAAEQLSNGSGKLKDGLEVLLSSSGTLKNGMNQLADGTGQLLAGSKQLSDGADALQEGLQTAADKTKNELLPGVQKLDDGVAGMQNELSKGIQTLGTGVSDLHAGMSQVSQGTQGLDAVVNNGTAETGGVSLKDLSQKTAEDAKNLAMIAATEAGNSATEDAIIMLEALAADHPELQGNIDAVIEKLNTEKGNGQTANAAAGVAQEAAAVSAIVNKVSGGISQLNTGVSKAETGAAQLNAAVNDSKEGLGAKVAAGIGALKQGTEALRNGVDGNHGLASGLNQLSAGAKSVRSGSNMLSDKMNTADAGAKKAAAGMTQLENGASQLNSGAGSLNDGIQQLTELFEGDIKGMLEQMDEMLDTSKEYQSFSGIADGMDGQVKFVFVTE